MNYQELYDYVKELKDDIKDVKADIKDVKADIKNTYDEVKKVNGRLRATEGDIIRVSGVVESRGITCGKKLEELVPALPLMRYLNNFSKRPKLFLFLFITFIVGVQTFVSEIVQNNWLGILLKIVKP